MSSARGYIWVNGDLTRAEDAHVGALDRGLLYGDGVFETIRAYAGVPFRLAAHVDRLLHGATVLQIPIPVCADDLYEVILSTLAVDQMEDASVRVMLTRGPGGSPSDLRPAAEPSLIVHARPFSGYPANLYTRGMSAQVCRVRRNETSPLCFIKSLNYLDNLLARAEAARAGYDEAILLNTCGMVAEGTATNVFVVVKGAVVTPPTYDGVLAGIARQAVIDVLDVGERSISLDDLLKADEVFLTNSLMEIMPLVSLDGEPIGPGTPGPMAFETRRRYRLLVAEECGVPPG